MAIAGKAIYIFHAIYIPRTFFTKSEQIRVTELPKINVGKKKAGSITPLDFRLYYKPTVIKTVAY